MFFGPSSRTSSSLASAGIMGLEEAPDLVHDLGTCPIATGDVLLHHLAVADDVRLREFEGAVIRADSSVSVACGAESRAETAQEISVRFLVLVHAHREDDDPRVLHLLLKLAKRGRFLNARRAPGCPEVQD